MNCSPVYLVQNNSTPMSLAMPSLLRVTTSLLHRSISIIWQIHQFIYKECCSQVQNYDVTIKYWAWHEEMLVADALSHYAPLKAPDTPIDITINHVHITPNRTNWVSGTLIQDDLLLHSLPEMIICRLARWYQQCPTCSITHTMATETPSQLKMAYVLWGEALIIPPCQKGRRSSKQYTKDTWESASAKTEPDTVCIGQESTQTSNVSLNHAQHANVTAHRNHNSCSSQHLSPVMPVAAPQVLITST